MSLEIDLKNAVNNTADNFTCKLMQLMMKADMHNWYKLASVYPEEAKHVRAYMTGTPLETSKIVSAAGINFRV